MEVLKRVWEWTKKYNIFFLFHLFCTISSDDLISFFLYLRPLLKRENFASTSIVYKFWERHWRWTAHKKSLTLTSWAIAGAEAKTQVRAMMILSPCCRRYDRRWAGHFWGVVVQVHQSKSSVLSSLGLCMSYFDSSSFFSSFSFSSESACKWRKKKLWFLEAKKRLSKSLPFLCPLLSCLLSFPPPSFPPLSSLLLWEVLAWECEDSDPFFHRLPHPSARPRRDPIVLEKHYIKWL